MIRTIFNPNKGYYLSNPKKDTPHPAKVLEVPVITNGFDQLKWLGNDYYDYEYDKKYYSEDEKNSDYESFSQSAYIVDELSTGGLTGLPGDTNFQNIEEDQKKQAAKGKSKKRVTKQERQQARQLKRRVKEERKHTRNKRGVDDFNAYVQKPDVEPKAELLKQLYKEASKSEFDRVLKFYDITVYKEDLYNLNDDEWLNDNNISFVYEYLSRVQIKPTLKARMKYCKENDSQIVLLMPTFSFLLAHHPNPEELKGVLPPIIDSSFVFMPVNDNEDLDQPEGGSHWSLLLLCPKDKKCFVYDSMYLGNETETLNLIRKVEQFYGFDFEVITDKYTPQQINGSDCGILVVAITALLLARILNVDNNTYIDLSMRHLSISAIDSRVFILGSSVNMMKDCATI